MLKFISSIFLSVISFTAVAQQGDGGIPIGFKNLINKDIEINTYTFNEPDIIALRKEDKINDSLKNSAWRFGFNYETSFNLNNSGGWFNLQNGGKVWLLKISSENAKTINLAFSNTEIPEGNELYVYNPEKTFILGKFTQNHIYQKEMGTELVPGNTVIIEYYVPKFNIDKIGSIEISTVTHGYRTAKEYQEKAFGSSGNCNMNVNCPDGQAFSNQRNSVVMLVVGSNGFCTGALINNTDYDGKPYVLTANHCYSSNLANWLFRFKWQSDNCNNPQNEPSFESLSGAVLRARRTPTDFCLVEITGGLSSGTVPANCSPYFSGWNRNDAAPNSTFSIHHPSGDIKKISFDDDPPVSTQTTIGVNTSEQNGVWKVVWDRNTVTEGGSSGSPLFNNYGQIIGQLWGGQSTCGNAGTPNAYDFYGRFHNSWNPEGSFQNEQLKHWLDPNNSNNTAIYGFDPYQNILNINAAALNIEYTNKQCSKSFTPKVEIQNRGLQQLTSLVLQYTYNNMPPQTINWSGNLNTYQTVLISLPEIANVNGNNQISVELLSVNGQADDDGSDDTITVNYTANISGVSLHFEFHMSCWPEENSWLLTDLDGNIIYSGDNYPVFGQNANFLVTEEFCLPNGCYELILKDDFGDGVAGAQYSTCDYNGSMLLTYTHYHDILLAQMTEEESDFGHERKFNFCIDKVGLQTNKIKNEVIIFPNPNTGSFTVETDLKGKKNIVITDISGAIIESFETIKQNWKYENNRLSKGIYFITITNDNNRIVSKIAIE